jgi:hypothetical protein
MSVATEANRCCLGCGRPAATASDRYCAACGRQLELPAIGGDPVAERAAEQFAPVGSALASPPQQWFIAVPAGPRSPERPTAPAGLIVSLVAGLVVVFTAVAVVVILAVSNGDTNGQTPPVVTQTSTAAVRNAP